MSQRSVVYPSERISARAQSIMNKGVRLERQKVFPKRGVGVVFQTIAPKS
ncbi:MAG: hypothetical protein JRN52_15630 [Nitrososphaerota archaeon]|nr:hypothetical protein [Nitrososphaerota archaeon]